VERSFGKPENEGEARLALYLYQELRSAGVPAKSMALLSPYVAQVRLLKQMGGLDEGIEIGSIDGYQGREKEAIILSLVRSNDKGEVGFLGDTRRMNVGMTRARRLLIVLGDSTTWPATGFTGSLSTTPTITTPTIPPGSGLKPDFRLSFTWA